MFTLNPLHLTGQSHARMAALPSRRTSLSAVKACPTTGPRPVRLMAIAQTLPFQTYALEPSTTSECLRKMRWE